ncbi:AmmeMemoRadiSam system protein B [Candidatus Uhrbacteria bacterium]|nr:AmmeMemoRadiSam system protein B [Candidatus Uhrbacteria bacterium]
MSLAFSCIVAHTPLLMPTIGRDSIGLIAKTRDAMLRLEQELYLSQPETVIVVSPHGQGLPDSVTIDCSPEFTADFEEFGDLVTKNRWRGDVLLIDRIREDFNAKHLPLSLSSVSTLDYGCTVPLWYLTQHLPKVKVVPVFTSGLDAKNHYEIGRQMKDEILNATKRVAVVASADLSHRVGENSPQGLSPRGVAYDEKVQELVRNRDLVGLTDIDESWANEASACGDKVLAVLAGIMDEVQHEPEILSYEKPLGVGYLVANLKMA